VHMVHKMVYPKVDQKEVHVTKPKKPTPLPTFNPTPSYAPTSPTSKPTYQEEWTKIKHTPKPTHSPTHNHESWNKEMDQKRVKSEVDHAWHKERMQKDGVWDEEKDQKMEKEEKEVQWHREKELKQQEWSKEQKAKVTAPPTAEPTAAPTAKSTLPEERFEKKLEAKEVHHKEVEAKKEEAEYVHEKEVEGKTIQKEVAAKTKDIRQPTMKPTQPFDEEKHAKEAEKEAEEKYRILTKRMEKVHKQDEPTAEPTAEPTTEPTVEPTGPVCDATSFQRNMTGHMQCNGLTQNGATTAEECVAACCKTGAEDCNTWQFAEDVCWNGALHLGDCHRSNNDNGIYWVGGQIEKHPTIAPTPAPTTPTITPATVTKKVDLNPAVCGHVADSRVGVSTTCFSYSPNKAGATVQSSCYVEGVNYACYCSSHVEVAAGSCSLTCGAMKHDSDGHNRFTDCKVKPTVCSYTGSCGKKPHHVKQGFNKGQKYLSKSTCKDTTDDTEDTAVTKDREACYCDARQLDEHVGWDESTVCDMDCEGVFQGSYYLCKHP